MRCDNIVEIAQGPSKNEAKRKAAQLLLEQLAARYGAEQPGT